MSNYLAYDAFIGSEGKRLLDTIAISTAFTYRSRASHYFAAASFESEAGRGLPFKVQGV